MEKVARIATHLLAWLASLGTAVAACAAVYFLSINNLKVRPEFAFFHTEISHWVWGLVCSLRGAQGSRAVVAARADTSSAEPKELPLQGMPHWALWQEWGTWGVWANPTPLSSSCLPEPMVSLGTVCLVIWGETRSSPSKAHPFFFPRNCIWAGALTLGTHII